MSGWRTVEHDPVWVPARLPTNRFGQTRPGWACAHQLENGNGQCGATVLHPADAYGKHTCVVEVDDEEAARG